MTDTNQDLTSPTSDLPVRNSDADDGGNVERITLELQQISNAPPGTITEVNQSPPKLSSIRTGTNAEVSHSPPRLSSVPTLESSVVYPDLLEPGDDPSEADGGGESGRSTLEFKQGSNPPPGNSPEVTHSPPRLSSGTGGYVLLPARQTIPVLIFVRKNARSIAHSTMDFELLGSKSIVVMRCYVRDTPYQYWFVYVTTRTVD